MGEQLSLQLAAVKKSVYQQRGINAVQLLFKKHFQSLADQYEYKYAIIYGRFRIERITEVVEKFIRCGDYSQPKVPDRVGIARIQCTNPDCKYEYFRPFSCKGFYFCPSCSQKRTLLFSQYMKDRLLLSLPLRQFVFTVPWILRPYFRHNRRLFSEISRLIFAIIERFYTKAAKRPIKTGMVLAPFGNLRPTSQAESFYDGTPTFIASCWKAASMRRASSYISLSGISTECRSTFAE